MEVVSLFLGIALDWIKTTNKLERESERERVISVDLSELHE